MKAFWAACFVAMFAVSSQAAPTITAFLNSGEIVGSNLTAGTTCAVEWASAVTGTWYRTWTNLEAIPVGATGTIRVGVPLFYRLQDAITVDVTTTTSTTSTTSLDTTTTTTTSSTTTTAGGPPAPLSAGDVAIIRMNASDDTFTVLALRDLDSSLVLHWTDDGWQSNNTFRANEAAGNVDVLTTTISAGNTFEVGGTGLANGGEQLFLFSGTLGLPTLLFGVDWGNTAGWDADSTSASTSADPATTGGGLSDVDTLSVGTGNNWEYRGIQSGTVADLLAAISTASNWFATNSASWTNGTFSVSGAGTTTTSTTTSTSTSTDTSTTTTSSTSSTTAPASPNKLAFVAINADNNDDFAVVALSDVAATSTLYFTDNEWNGQSVGGGGAFNTGEAILTWNTGGATINAGTVVAFNSVGTTNLITTTAGTVSGNGMNIAGSSEAIFLYEGTTPTNPTAILAAIGNGTAEASTFGSLAGTGLITNLTAIVITGGKDIAEYQGPRTGQTGVGYLPLIGNVASNWISEAASGDQSTNGIPPDLPFDLTPFAQ